MRKYADFSGRAARSEFWWFMLFGAIVGLGSMWLDGSLGDPSGNLGWLTIILSIALFLPFVAVTVRRLHDRDMTGWWFLLNVIPVGGFILLIICALAGTPGDNRFGPVPGSE